MIGKITKIDVMKSSHNQNQTFQRVHFSLQIQSGVTEYAHTDLVPSFRNYARWKSFLRVGTVLGGLDQLKSGKIDADSRVVLISEPAEYVSSRVVPVETKRLF